MSPKRTLVLCLSVAALGLVLAPQAPAASGPTYGLSGAYVPPCTGVDCPPTVDYTWSGTASCIRNCAGAPASGSFTSELSGSGGFFPRSCVSRKATGSFSAVWSDATFTTVSLSAHSRDKLSYHVWGITDPSSTFLPLDPYRGNWPFPASIPNDPHKRNACRAGTVSIPSDPYRISFGS